MVLKTETEEMSHCCHMVQPKQIINYLIGTLEQSKTSLSILYDLTSPLQDIGPCSAVTLHDKHDKCKKNESMNKLQKIVNDFTQKMVCPG